MSEFATATGHDAKAAETAVADPSSRLTKLTVSAHLMTLDAGLFCILNSRNGGLRDGSGLPGVRVSPAPGPASRPDAVTISTFRDDGWLSGPEDAALVRVASGQAQILVTIYQLPQHGTEAAPQLQVMRLNGDMARPSSSAVSRPVSEAALVPVPAGAELLAHVSRMGDVTARLGDWVGRRGSKQAVEGFSVAPQPAGGVKVADIEYQAVLGRGWLSPWVEGGTFCGSRGMALPVLGLRVRLRGAAADAFDCGYSATFVDGTEVGPVQQGEACEADSLAPLEAFQVTIARKAVPVQPERTEPAAAGSPRQPRAVKSARRAR